MMRHSCLFRPVSGLLGHIFVYMAVACSVSSCIDDTFNKYQQEDTGLLTFDVKVPGNWTNGLSRAATDISIRRMSQSDNAEPLYLVTEISEVAADAAASDAATEEAVTRGSTVNSIDDFHTNFGLSAICYTGTWPKDEPTDWSTDFAHNLKVEKNGASWKLEDGKQLNWLGTGRIRFFAYSPYSATNESGIIHSAPGKGGIPTLTYTVPTDVKEQRDLMTAMEDYPGGQGGAVELKFKHALTAVTIKTGSAILEGKITKVSFKGVYGAGTHQIGSDQWTTTGDPKEFSVDLNIDLEKETPNKSTTKDENNADATAGNDGAIVDYAKPGTEIIGGDLTFLMIPQKLPKDATLEIEYQDKPTKTSRTLTAKLGEKEEIWPMGKKVVYSISSTGIIVGPPTIDLKINHHDIWMNGIEPSAAEQNAYLPVSGYLRDVQLAAYTKVTQAGEATKIINFSSSVEIEYSTDGGNNWTLITKDNGGWLPATQTKADISALANEDDPIPYVPGSILLPAQTAFQELRTAATQHTNGAFNLDMIGNNSSPDGYYDLVENNPVARESANCYVINQPGYYKFPTWYGNTYNNSDKSAYTYTPSGSTPTLDNYILKNFVGHDDLSIDGTQPIPGIEDAVLVWQDSPDLVTDIKYNDGWVYFYMPKEAFNQGNSVIAVRNKEGKILWSWHIWATYCNLDQYQESKAVNEKGKNFLFLCYNLGYCDPHKGNEQRPIKIRFYATMPNDTRQQITNVSVTAGENPITEGKDGVLTFTQPAIIESMAGDNTYFQWGRKDPMLPGVYNNEILEKAPLEDGFLPEGQYVYPYKDDGTKNWANYKEELDMVNKVFYSTTKYKFHSEKCGRSIGESIRMPHLFFIYTRPGVNGDTDTAQDKDGTKNYLRRHWHNGENTTLYNQKTIMNFWNSQLDTNGPTGKSESPNDKYVIKTIYDPSPAGYKIPPPTAFSMFAKPRPNPTPPTTPYGSGMPDELLTDFKETSTGWEIREEGGELFFFPATGVRDMGIHHRAVEYGTFPAHSKLTFIASSGFQSSSTSSSCLLFSIDSRAAAVSKKNHVGILYGTNNAYGFTLRPIRDHRQ